MEIPIIIFSLFALLCGVIIIPLGLGLAKGCGLYAVVNEREALVYTLFGKVLCFFRDVRPYASTAY